MTATMRTGPAARDPGFRGIDPPALNQLIKQLQDAQNAIKSWLNGHRPPPEVSAAGYRQADQVAQWAADELGMLTRRYNYAITHPDPGGGVNDPPTPTPAPTPSRSPQGGGGGVNASPAPAPAPKTPSRSPQGGGGTSRPVTPPKHTHAPKQTTPRGAGDLGNFPNRQAASKAARVDALAVAAAFQDGKPVPDTVWKHLKANADDPDYTEKLYERLGPAATADLLDAAHGDRAKLTMIEESLGIASHHLTMDVKWLRAFLAEADRAGARPVAVQVLTGAEMSKRTREAIAKLDLEPTTRPAKVAG